MVCNPQDALDFHPTRFCDRTELAVSRDQNGVLVASGTDETEAIIR
jgi:hypothetical protein